MLMEQATAIRKEWSVCCDEVMHQRPKFIKRTRDRMWFSSLDTMSDILEGYKFTATLFVECDDSVTLSLNEIDIVENGKNEQEARLNLAKAILEYATEFYDEYEIYSKSLNRKKHIPYIFKALIIDDTTKIGEMIHCLDGKN